MESSAARAVLAVLFALGGQAWADAPPCEAIGTNPLPSSWATLVGAPCWGQRPIRVNVLPSALSTPEKDRALCRLAYLSLTAPPRIQPTAVECSRDPIEKLQFELSISAPCRYSAVVHLDPAAERGENPTTLLADSLKAGARKRNERWLRELFLVRALAASKTIQLDPDGEFVETKSGRKIGVEDAYELLRAEGPGARKYATAALELAAALAAGSAYYYSHLDWAMRDWDLEPGEWRKKLLFEEGTVSLDDNDLGTNYLGHTVAGAGYFLAARGNGFTYPESLLASAVTSALWELGPEALEQWSVNDLIVTPVAGAALGEAIHRLVSRGRAGARSRAVGGKGAGDIEASAEVSASLEGVRVTAEAATMSFSRREGSSAREAIGPGEWTRVATTLGLSGSDAGAIELLARSAIAGFHRRETREKGRGYSFLVTVDQGYEYGKRFAIAEVVGGRLELRAFLGGAEVRVGLEGGGGLGQVHSAAFEEYRQDYQVTHADSILRETGDYHALAARGAPFAELISNAGSLGARAELVALTKISGLDTDPIRSTEPLSASDTESRLSVWADAAIPRTPIRVGVEQLWERSSGAVEDSGGNRTASERSASTTQATLRMLF